MFMNVVDKMQISEFRRGIGVIGIQICKLTLTGY